MAPDFVPAYILSTIWLAATATAYARPRLKNRLKNIHFHSPDSCRITARVTKQGE